MPEEFDENSAPNNDSTDIPSDDLPTSDTSDPMESPTEQMSGPNGGNENDPNAQPAAATGVARSLLELGDYHLIRKMGEGGMGVVYEARQKSLGDRRLAVKTLKQPGSFNPRALQRFQNEARAAAQLDHRHIVPVYSVGENNGTHFYVMRFIEGHNLAELFRTLRSAASGDTRVDDKRRSKSTAPNSSRDSSHPSGWSKGESLASQELLDRVAQHRSNALPQFWDAFVRLGIQVASALHYAHEMGVVHRDIKPSNLILDVEGDAWVVDFGLAQVKDNPSDLTMTGDLIGTYRYMSPEQAMGMKRLVVDERTDIYSLGVTLYELLTLNYAFNGDSREEILRKINFYSPPTARKLDNRIPKDLETILEKAMAKNPRDRFETAGEMAAELKRFQSNLPIKSRRPSPVQRVRQWSRANPTKLASIATLFLCSFIASIVITAFSLKAYAEINDARLIAEGEKEAAIGAKRETERMLRRSEGLRLASNASRYSQDASLSLLLGLEAAKLHPGRTANNTLQATLDASREFRTLTGYPSTVGHVSFNRTGTRILTSGTRNNYKRGKSGAFLWDVKTGALLHRFQDENTTTTVTSAVYGPENVRILTTSSPEPNRANDDIDGKRDSRPPRLWEDVAYRNLATFEDAFLFETHDQLFSPSGQRVVLPAIGNVAKIYDITGNAIQTFTGHQKRVVYAAFGPKGQRIATASDDNTVRIWNADTGEQTDRFDLWAQRGSEKTKSAIDSLAFRPDGRQLVTCSGEFGIHLWDLSTGKRVTDNFVPGNRATYWGDGMRLLTHRRGGRALEERLSSRLERLDGMRPTRGYVEGATISPDARSIAIFGHESPPRVGIWDAHEGTLRAYLQGHQSAINDVAFSPNSDLLATASNDKTVKLWHLDDGLDRSTVATMFNPLGPISVVDQLHSRLALSTPERQESVQPISFGRDDIKGAEMEGRVWMSPYTDTRFVVTDNDKLTLHEIEKGLAIKSTLGSFGKFGQAAINRKGDRVAMCANNKPITIWIPDEDRHLPLLVGPGLINHLNFHPDGERLFSSGADGFARVWDATSGESLATINLDASVIEVKFTPDGSRFVTVTDQNFAVIWDANSYEEVSRIRNADVTFRRAEFNFDGRFLVTFREHDSGKVATWDVETGQLRHQQAILDRCHVAVHPKQNELLIASKKGIVIWPFEEESTLSVTDQSHLLCAYARDGSHILATSEVPRANRNLKADKTVYPLARLSRWKRDDLESRDEFVFPFGSATDLMIGGDDTAYVNLDHPFGAMVYDSTTLLPTARIRGHLAPITDMAWNKSREELISVGRDRRVIVTSVLQQTHKTLTGHDDVVSKVAVSPDDDFLLTADRSGNVFRWNAASGTLEKKWNIGPAPISQLSISPKGSQFAAIDEAGGLYLHDLVADGEVKVRVDAEQFVWAEYSRDGKYLLLIPGKAPSFLDLLQKTDPAGGQVLVVATDGSAVFRYSYEQKVITSHFHPAEDKIVTLCRDGKILFQEVESRKTTKTYSHGGKMLQAAVLNPAADFLAIADSKSLTIVRTRDMKPWLSLPRKPLNPFPLHQLDPFQLGKNRLITGRTDEYQFRIAPLYPTKTAEQTVSRKLTEEERERFEVPRDPEL